MGPQLASSWSWHRGAHVDLAPSPRSHWIWHYVAPGTGQSTERSVAPVRVTIATEAPIIVCRGLRRTDLTRNPHVGYALRFTAYAVLILYLPGKQRTQSRIFWIVLCYADMVWIVVWSPCAAELRAAVSLSPVPTGAGRHYEPTGAIKTAGKDEVVRASELLQFDPTPGRRARLEAAFSRDADG
jgi:hypothetical protein